MKGKKVCFVFDLQDCGRRPHIAGVRWACRTKEMRCRWS